MSFIIVIILAVIQGLTEFLPVSSSGHLVLAQHYLPGFSANALAFDVLLHFGTLVSLVIYFFGDLRRIVVSFFRWTDQEGADNRRLGWLIVIGSIPAAVVGLLFEDQIAALFQNVRIVPYMLLITAAFLFFSERAAKPSRDMGDVGVKEAIVIGVLQAVAIIPGISRSGSTIAGGLMTGLTRDASARFSFILSIPAVFGAFVLSLKDFSEFHWAYGIGAVIACLVGLFAIWLTFRFVVTRHLWIFSLYLVIAGGFFIILDLL